GTIATVIISWLITGTLALAFSIGFIELISKLILYYFHERTWNKIKWGK
ncbi:MAG: putative membrane protein, partial [Candidatus Azotimanducaceae bacterium]